MKENRIMYLVGESDEGMERKSFLLSATFSPSMLGGGVRAMIEEIEEEEAKSLLLSRDFVSYVGHEITASILSHRLGRAVGFNRSSLILEEGDELIAAVPQFRGEIAREFTHEEIAGAKFRYFLVKVEGRQNKISCPEEEKKEKKGGE